MANVPIMSKWNDVAGKEIAGDFEGVAADYEDMLAVLSGYIGIFMSVPPPSPSAPIYAGRNTAHKIIPFPGPSATPDSRTTHQ